MKKETSVILDELPKHARARGREGGWKGRLNVSRKNRSERLMPKGVPRYVHVYDNGGESADRYCVVFTGRYGWAPIYLAMSAAPFHPQGVCVTGESDKRIDYPRYSHLGKRIAFDALPKDCQKAARNTYCDLWSLCVKCYTDMAGNYTICPECGFDSSHP